MIGLAHKAHMSNIERLLSPHVVIGWDVDGTILDHPKARLMHDYIRDHPEKRHIVVTFRSHGWEKVVWDDINEHHEDFPLEPGLFQGILNVPNATYAAYELARKTTLLGMDDPRIVEYLEWKGRMCSENGITVLVDDLTDVVIRGCDRYGVTHVHPDWF
jgi:hypothetical protein